MAIHFPCLQTDISEWFPSTQEDFRQGPSSDEHPEEEALVETLRHFLLSPRVESANNENKVIEVQPGKSKWLHTSAKSNGDDNIMSPVLKSLPNSHWLLNNEQEESKLPTDVKAPTMETSLWLASSSIEPLTCMTRETCKKAMVEFPEYFFSSSPNMWLVTTSLKGKPVKTAEDLESWLMVGSEVQTEQSMDHWAVFASEKPWLVAKDLDDEIWGMEDSGMDTNYMDDNSSIAILDNDDLDSESFDIVESNEWVYDYSKLRL